MKNISLLPSDTLMDAVRMIESTVRRIAVVTNVEGKVVGTVTDGDVRRCLLNGGSLSTKVMQAMNTKPVVLPAGSSVSLIRDFIQKLAIAAIPLVNECGRLVSVVHISDLPTRGALVEEAGFEFAVIMAGGEGVRLRPITESIPKAMVDVGGLPIIERQIQSLRQVGVRKVFIAVNYLSHVIEAHFGNGQSWGVEIHYIHEQKKLGTGGALSLLPDKPLKPIVVMNGDIITGVNFGALFSFHASHGSDLTVAAVEYNVSIPFGVLNNDGPFVTDIAEKPSQRFLCNAGIYAVSPGALEFVPLGFEFNMPDLVSALICVNRKVAVFPLHEYWSDVGTISQLEEARRRFNEAANEER